MHLSLYPEKMRVTHIFMLRMQVFLTAGNSEWHHDASRKGHLMAQITVIFMGKTSRDWGKVVCKRKDTRKQTAKST